MLKPLFVSSTSACFELVNKNPYYSPAAYKIILNGKQLEKEYDTNVFSLFGLTPSASYTLKTTVDDGEITFSTLTEAGVIDVKALGARADGVSDDTFFIQTAIDSCPKGGRVLLKAGKYLTRPIELKSDITVELEKGAVLLGGPLE